MTSLPSVPMTVSSPLVSPGFVVCTPKQPAPPPAASGASQIAAAAIAASASARHSQHLVLPPGMPGAPAVIRGSLVRALEVLGEDVVRPQRVDESLDLILHVRAGQAGQILNEHVGAAVELDVEPVDDLLGVDAVVAPFAVGAPKFHGPVALVRGSPLERIHEIRPAGLADVQFACARRGLRPPGRERERIDAHALSRPVVPVLTRCLAVEAHRSMYRPIPRRL